MNEDKKALCKEYAEIESKIKELKSRQDEIKPEILSEMETLGVEQVKSDFGTFYFTSRKSWNYPEYVKEAETIFKNKKKESEENGDAKFEESKSLSFRAK